MRLQLMLCILFGVWLHGVWLLSLPKQCGHTQGPGNSQLGAFISAALRLVSKTSAPLCVIEVGTADGSGTTMALNDALYRKCIPPGGRSFDITSYEGIPELAKVASERWAGHDNVHIVNELMITEENIRKYVLPAIDAPDGDDFHGRGFYERLYANAKRDFFHTSPVCGPVDLVLIDSTRYAHSGIIATLRNGLVHDDTVYVVEDDLGVRAELEKHWRLRDVLAQHPSGEQWPWIIFRIDNSFQTP